MRTLHPAPDKIWIEMSLSAQTCLLVWRAMAASGLREGKINSFEEEHFGPNYSWQPHLVEGRTSQGIFATNVKVQAKLTEKDGGTLLEFAAANIEGHSDFGASQRIKRRLVPLIEKFLREATADGGTHDREEVLTAPLASPSDVGSPAISGAPRFDVIVPVRESSSWPLLGIVAIVLAGTLFDRFQLWGPVFLMLSAWQWWNSQIVQKKWSRIAIVAFLLCLVMGIYDSWLLLARWL